MVIPNFWTAFRAKILISYPLVVNGRREKGLVSLAQQEFNNFSELDSFLSFKEKRNYFATLSNVLMC